MIRVTSREPCPICAKPDWCGVSEDGARVVCMRVESDRRGKNGGWVHALADAKPREWYKPRPAAVETPAKNFGGIAKAAFDALRFPRAEAITRQLGITLTALREGGVGWLPRRGAYTFPMWDWPRGANAPMIVGIRTRCGAKKLALPGSRNGIFAPTTRAPGRRVLIVEGATDHLAALDLGFYAIGRPSNQAGGEYVLRWLRGDVRFLTATREIWIIAQRDTEIIAPGQNTSVAERTMAAAHELAKIIPKRYLTSVRRVVEYKDLRAAYNAGGRNIEEMTEEAK